MDPKVLAPTSSFSPYSVLVSKDLMQVINPVGKEMTSENLTTMDKVLNSVRDYIIQRKLFDPENPVNIIVKNDELGSIFGLSEFKLFDIRKILEKFVFPVSSKDADSAEVICSYSVSEKALKRKLEAPEDIVKSKKCLNAGYDSEDSVYSVQDYETEFVKDTSDDSLCLVDENSLPGGSILTIEETYDVDVEYEIESDSDSNRDPNCFTSDSGSDFEEVIKSAIVPFLCETYSDAEYLADNSSDDNTNSFDVEIPDEDKWLCKTCSIQNHPLCRHCASCWRLRNGWVSTKQPNSERNIRKRKARNRKKDKNATDVKNEESSKNDQFDSPSTSQENLSLPSSSYSSENGSQSSKSEGENKDSNAKLCIICCSKPVNSSIIHGKVGHSVSCYRCARKLHSRNERCPICRRIIERVVYLISN